MLESTDIRLEGGKLVRVAETQPEYTPVGAVFTTHPGYSQRAGWNSVIMAFALTGEERQRVINGESIYVSLLTFGEPQQGIMLSVGPEEMASAHNLTVKEPIVDEAARRFRQTAEDEFGLHEHVVSRSCNDPTCQHCRSMFPEEHIATRVFRKDELVTMDDLTVDPGPTDSEGAESL